MIKIKVTRERYNQVMLLEDGFRLLELSDKDAYDYMTQFIVNEAGEYITQDAARKLFKAEKVKRAEITRYWMEFVKAITDAFVNPTSGAVSDSPTSLE